AASASEAQIETLGRFGEKLGLAFQILDDLLDAAASPESIGKDVDQDGRRPSLVLIIGLEAAWREARAYAGEATALIPGGGGEAALRHFAMGLVAGLENKLDLMRDYQRQML
ncbi:MAG TPA: polyprenyl synthetase family protein, partial [Hyphomicrobiales bacterium]